MPRYIEAEQADEPEHDHDGYLREQQLRMLQEGQGVVAEEGDDGVVSIRQEIQRVAEEEADPVFFGNERHQEELHYV